MKTHIEPINSASSKVTVTFDTKFCDEVRLSILKKAQAQAVLPGFRKGKVPLELLKQRYSEALAEDFRQGLVLKVIDHLKKEDKLDIVAIAKANFDRLEKEQILELEVELRPTFDLPDYKNFKLDEKKIEVSADEKRDFVERLQKQQASYDVVDRAAKAKDYVKLSYSGVVDGTPVDDFTGVPHLWAQQKMTWEEADSADGTGIPEITKGLVGLKAGDKKEIEVVFPEDFVVEALRQKKAVYTVEVLEVREVKLPELNEAFFEKFQVKNLEELNQFAEKSIATRKEQDFEARQKQKISEYLTQSVTCELPESWVKIETDKVLQEMVNVFSSHGVKQDMLEEQKSVLFEKAQTIARNRIKLNLCFEEIFDIEKVKLDAHDIERVLAQEAAQRHMAPQKLLQQVRKDEYVRNDIQGKVLQAKMINWLYKTLSQKEQ